jgi:N utilization substance protein A
VRLAAKLAGWKIDIKSEEEKRKEVEAQLAGIEFGDTTIESHPLSLPDIHDDVVASLRAGGYDTVEKVIDAAAEQLLALPGFDAETVEAVVAAARLERDRQQEAAAAETGTPAPEESEPQNQNEESDQQET